MMHSHTKYILILPLLFLLGCGSSTSNTETNTNNSTTTPKQNENNNTLDSNQSLITKNLNDLRVKSGMIALSQNSLLTKSAKNHANYLSYNKTSGHYESGANKYFTGEAPLDRTKYVAYQSRRISENISVGQGSEALSLDGLMGAIYHRFGFLKFDINEVGASYTGNSYVYDMGNSQLSTLCQGSSFESNGKYYYNICLDETFKIKKEIYDEALTKTESKNSSYVIYPYANEENITPSFYNESPDPLPDYNVSGIPISIQFNPVDFNMSKLSINNFTLKDENNNSVELISYNDNTNIMKKSNDVNQEFNKYEFAIFPQNRLNYNEKYHVNFSYNYNGNDSTINWDFKTKRLENLLIYHGNSLQISLDKKYYIYIPPQDKNDVINKFTTHCTYNQGGNPSIESSLYDGNTLNVKITGSSVQSCELNLDNGRTITLNIK